MAQEGASYKMMTDKFCEEEDKEEIKLQTKPLNLHTLPKGVVVHQVILTTYKSFGKILRKARCIHAKKFVMLLTETGISKEIMELDLQKTTIPVEGTWCFENMGVRIL